MSHESELVSLPMAIPSVEPAQDEQDSVIRALETCFDQHTHLEVWHHCTGQKPISDIPEFAQQAADHIIVVCLDCEHWSNNTEETTEVGIATFARQDVAALVNNGTFGSFGEPLMQQVRFYLLRMIETSHLPNQNPDSRGVLGNRFGEGRFVTFAEARQIMHDLFVQPIRNVPGLKGNHPIVVLGHDVGHDKNNLKHKAIEFDMDPLGTVVKYVDTQQLVRDANYWYMPNNEQIGLARLVGSLWFNHSDPHTAANDAGRTLICAFQLGLAGHKCTKEIKKNMQEVANSIEQYSVANFKPIGGVKEYCWRCGQSGHMKSACMATNLHCDECTANDCRLEPGEDHVTAHCMCIANKKAALRRERDALARARKKQKSKYTPRERSFSYDHGRPLAREQAPRPSFLPGRIPHPRQMNGHEVTFNHRRLLLKGSWRTQPSNELGNRSNNGYSNELSNGKSAIWRGGSGNRSSSEPGNGLRNRFNNGPNNRSSDRTSNELSTRFANEQSIRPGNGLSYRPSHEQTTRAGNELSNGSGNERGTRPSNGLNFRPGNGLDYRPGNGLSYSPGGGMSYRLGNEQITRSGNGLRNRLGNGLNNRPGNELSYRPVNGLSNTPSNGLGYRPANGSISRPDEPRNGPSSMSSGCGLDDHKWSRD